MTKPKIAEMRAMFSFQGTYPMICTFSSVGTPPAGVCAEYNREAALGVRLSNCFATVEAGSAEKEIYRRRSAPLAQLVRRPQACVPNTTAKRRLVFG